MKLNTIFFTMILVMLCKPSSQALSAENLIKNPDYIDGQDFPSHWTFESTAPENFENKWVKNCYGKTAALEMICRHRDMSGYFVQWVPVKNGTQYRLKVCVKQIGGKGLVWITAYDANKKTITNYDRRIPLTSFIGNGLVPHFVPKHWMKGTDQDAWRELQIDLHAKSDIKDSPPIAYFRVNIGSYFSISHFWFSHVELIPIENEITHSLL